jgi:hypothetical protein
MGLRRAVTAALLLGAAGAALAPAGPDALVPFKILAASAAQEVYVAVVIDFGSGSNMSAVSQCVPVPAGDTDADALAVDNSVAYNNTGLLCAIDGYPANGVQNCTKTKGSEFYFWSYWHGSTGSWAYADGGPGTQTVADGDVEGWRFQNPGPASPSAPAPSVAPDYAQICGSEINPTTTTTTAGVTTTTSAGVTTTTSAGVTTTTSGSGTGPGPPTTTVPGSTKGPSGGGGTSGPSAPSSKSSSAPTTTTTTRSSSASATTSTTVPKGLATTTSSGATTFTESEHGHSSNRSEAAPASHHPKHSGGGGSVSLPLLLVAALIILLGVLALYRWRRWVPTE